MDLKSNGEQRKYEDGNSERREKEREKGEVLKIHKILLLTISSMLTIGGREERREGERQRDGGTDRKKEWKSECRKKGRGKQERRKGREGHLLNIGREKGREGKVMVLL